jgi:hypothetical protein
MPASGADVDAGGVMRSGRAVAVGELLRPCAGRAGSISFLRRVEGMRRCGLRTPMRVSVAGRERCDLSLAPVVLSVTFARELSPLSF